MERLGMAKLAYMKPLVCRVDIENDPIMAPAGCEDLENFFNSSGRLTGSTRTFTLQCGGGGTGTGNLHAIVTIDASKQYRFTVDGDWVKCTLSTWRGYGLCEFQADEDETTGTHSNACNKLNFLEINENGTWVPVNIPWEQYKNGSWSLYTGG